MHKLVALFRHPNDEQAFLHYYRTLHAPLVRKLPGLLNFSINKTMSSEGGKQPYFMISEMTFNDEAALENALASLEHHAVCDDLAAFAESISTFLTVEVDVAPSRVLHPSGFGYNFDPFGPTV